MPDLSPTLRLQAKFFFTPAVRIRTWKKLQAQMRNGMRLEESLRQLRQHAREAKSPLAHIYLRISTVTFWPFWGTAERWT